MMMISKIQNRGKDTRMQIDKIEKAKYHKNKIPSYYYLQYHDLKEREYRRICKHAKNKKYCQCCCHTCTKEW
jgi:hypothetical protein